MKEIQTELGTFKIEAYEVPKKYQCSCKESILKTDARHWKICTIGQSVKIKDSIYTPVVYQSCMHPEQVIIYPLNVERNGEYIKCRDRYHAAEYNLKEINTEVLPWYPKLKQKRCNPCQNCGRC